MSIRERISLAVNDHRDPSLIGSTQEFLIDHQFVADFSGSRIIFAHNQKNQEVVLKFSAYPYGNKREWSGLKKCWGQPFAQQGVLQGQTSDGQAAVVTNRVFGEPLTLTSSEANQYQLGKNLSKLHQSVLIESQEWIKYGRADRSYFQTSLERWQRSEQHTLPPESFALPLLQELISAVLKLPPETPAFTHQDLHDNQVLISEEALTLLDFEAWQEASPFEDLAIYLVHLLREQKDLSRFRPLIEGYFLTQQYTDQVALKLAFHSLFIATRAVHYFAQRLPQYVPQAQENLQRVSTYVAQEHLWRLRVAATDTPEHTNIPERRDDE